MAAVRCRPCRRCCGRAALLAAAAASLSRGLGARLALVPPSGSARVSGRHSWSGRPSRSPEAGLGQARRRAYDPGSSGSGGVLEPSLDAVEVPPLPFFAVMAADGALLGPILDGFHGRFGVNGYHDPPPFSVEVGGFELCQTAPWVPPLFGVAGILIGTLYVVGDRVFGTDSEKRSTGAETVLPGVLLFVLQYFLSAVLLGPKGLLGPALADPGQAEWYVAGAVEVLLWAYAILHWRAFDRTQVGLLVSLLTAIGGPMIEIFLLNAPWWDLYAYWAPNLLGIPTWIAPVYFCGGPAVGNLARATLNFMRPLDGEAR